MAARRLILVMLLVLMLSSFAAALVPVDDQGEDSTTTTTSTRSSSTAKLIERRMDAAEPRRKNVVRVELGDQLHLIVEAGHADEVEIPALGEFGEVDADLPATFDIAPVEARRYPVWLVNPDRQIGSVVAVGG